MPESAKETAERAVEIFNREFREGRSGISASARDLYVTEPVIVPFRAALEGNQYSGPTALDDFAAETRESWSWVRIDVREIREVDPTLALVVGELTGRGRTTGAETSSAIAFLIAVREERVTEIRTYTSEQDALAQVGR